MPPDLSPDAWAQIRHDYERTEKPVEDICAEHGISSGTLRDRMRRWGWTRRRAPIPLAGPPAASLWDDAPVGLAPALPSPASGGGISGNPPTCEGGLGAEGDAADDAPASAVADGGAIVPRLQSAVVRVLASIEATVGKLAAQPIHPREMEHAARALAALTRTLRELNALLRQHGAPADEDDEPEESIDEFRLRLARQMDAVIARRNTAAAGNTEPEGP